MRLKGPIVTLLAGVGIAVILLIANVRANSTGNPVGHTVIGAVPNTTAPGATALGTTAPGTLAPGATATHTSPPPAAQPPATYAGHTTGGTASIAIAVRDGKAIAYLCSGRIESWLRGTATGGVIRLTGTHHGALTATYAHGVAIGTATASGQHFAFTATVVHAPSGLWRASATVRKARILAGWIVLPDGSQIGMVNTDGTEAKAPAIDGTTHTADINGSTLTATPIDGATGTGF